LAFVASLAALLVAYLLAAVPGKWFPSAKPVHFGADALNVVTGTGAVEQGILTATPPDGSDTLIVSLSLALRSEDFPAIAWQVSGVPAGAEARLLWRNEYTPDRMFTVRIPIEGGEIAPIVVSSDRNWFGRIIGIALAVKLPSPAKVHIRGVYAEPVSAGAVLGLRAREWMTQEVWSGTSINTVVGGAEVPALPLPLLLGLATVLATAVSLLVGALRAGSIGPAFPAAVAAIFFVSWMVLDARWQWNLARQVRATSDQFAGKSWHEKHLASDDGELFAFSEKVRAKLPTSPVRVFVLADADYFRGRAAYYLYPHNVYFNHWVVPAASVRPNDYFVVFQRHNIQYDDRAHLLRWDGGPPVAADQLLSEPGAALFRIR
jgi:hypothetical protein